MTLQEINECDQATFVSLLGGIFEHSPWIAEAAWKSRPFSSRDHLHAEMCAAVEAAGEQKLLELIASHPDLVGRLARLGQLTRESAREQQSAGLTELSPGTMAEFEKWNAEYRAKFGFPFIICARLNSPETILQAFPERMANTRGQEISTAWKEIQKIAHLRLADVVVENSENFPVQSDRNSE